MSAEPTWNTRASLRDVVASVHERRTTSVALVEESLERIYATSHLNAFVSVEPELALRQAEQVDADPARFPLAGLTIAPKDMVDVAGFRSTYGSPIFHDRVADTTAPVVAALMDAGAIVVGKTNLDEFAWGIASRNETYGTVVNPRFPDRISGGSSGGAAAAVAAHLVAASVGTDTGGSIAIPAAACGVAGFKASYGSIPTQGVFPLAPSFDHVGPIAPTVEDCLLLADVMMPGLAVRAATPPRTIGVLGSVKPEALAPLYPGADVREVQIPDWQDVAVLSSIEAADVHHALFIRRRVDYSVVLQERLDTMLATTQVERARLVEALREWRLRARAALDVDVVVGPVLAGPLPAATEMIGDEQRMSLAGHTRPFNMLGWAMASSRDGHMFASPDNAQALLVAGDWERHHDIATASTKQGDSR